MEEINEYEQAVLNEAVSMIAGQTVFTIDIDFARNEIKNLFSHLDLTAVESEEMIGAIKQVSYFLSNYSEGYSKDALIAEISAICKRAGRGYGIETHIASDGTFAFESPSYTSRYELNTVAVVGYSSEHGMAPASKAETSYWNTTYTLTAGDLPVLTDDNATFKRWTLDGQTVSAGAEISGDVTLVAVWDVSTADYTISYVSEYGTAPASKTVTVNAGEAYALTEDDLPTLEAEGYNFLGWQMDGQTVSAGAEISASTILTAAWGRAVLTVTLTYYTAYVAAPDAKTVTFAYGGSYALTEADLPVLTADGYSFVGWTLNGAVVNVGDSISADAALAAVWDVAAQNPTDPYSRVKYELEIVSNTKANFKAQLESRGLTVSDVFASYGPLIESITGGSVEVQDEKHVTFNGITVEIEPDDGYAGIMKVIIKGDANLQPYNIAEGVEMYGVTGTACVDDP